MASKSKRFLKVMLLFLDAVLLLCFVAGYLARYIHPRHAWWLQLLALGLPFLSVALLVAGGLTALLNKWGLFSLHAIILLFALVRFAAPMRAVRVAPAEDAPPILTVMSFNAKNHYKSDAVSDRTMQNLLEEEQPDLVGLQEVSVWFLNAPARRGSDYHLRALFQKYRILRPENIPVDKPYKLPQPIFSSLDYEGSQPLQVLVKAPDTQTSISGTRGQFFWEGQPFAIYNIHLRSFTPDASGPKSLKRFNPIALFKRFRSYREDFLIRAQEAEQIRLLLEQEKMPFIVIGDFNSTPHNWVYQHIAKGLKDTYKIAGRGWGASFPSYFPILRIDYILTSSHWEVMSAYIEASKFSDHLPLIAKVVLPTSSAQKDIHEEL